MQLKWLRNAERRLIMDNKCTYRYLSRFVIEAETPLVVGSGDKDITTDALVATDVNGLPYIPGTAIAGVVRHAFDEIEKEQDPEAFINREDKDKKSSFFGYQIFKEPKDSKGSEIIFSEAKMVGKDGIVIDGLQSIDWSDIFYSHFKVLPIRQHVSIDERGAAKDKGKFDEQIVYKGTRFCFEIEMDSDASNFDKFKKVLAFLLSGSFRIGSGIHSGFGKIKIVSCKEKELDLNNKDDLSLYLKKSSSLADDWEGWDDYEYQGNTKDNVWIKYDLTLKPQDFFLFGSGLGDADANMTPVRESVIVWKEGKPEFEDNYVLIPATSVKGALAHRSAYYYNKANHFFADNLSKDEIQKYIGSNNIAVETLFGSEEKRDKDNNIIKNQKRGNVIFSDIIEKNDGFTDKLINHVSIDRFTGGAIDGALFTEKAVYGKGREFRTTLMVNSSAFKTEKVEESFEAALFDLCSGMLPLGGGVNRGNGVFEGTIMKNGTIIYPK